MSGNKLAIALVVLFITIIGVPIGVLGLRCATGVNQLQMELYEKWRQEYIQKHGSDEGFTSSDPRDDPNVDPVTCNFPFWKGFINDYGHKRERVRNTAVGILAGTVILDGIVIGAYMVFGREKKPPKHESETKQIES